MLYVFLFAILSLSIYGPQLWVRWVLAKHSRQLDSIPGTGSELARHLLKRFEFESVKVERTDPDMDHYSPKDNAVRLSPDVFDGKSLTAVAVAAHEVGHAIQFNRREAVSKLRGRYLSNAETVKRVGTFVLVVSPSILAILHSPHALLVTVVIGILTMIASVALYVAILPEEWDASFNKALPILIEGKYVDEQEITQVKQILTACALTYVAGALADIVRLWRWTAILRR